jgi:hypothetical protein
VPGFTATSSRSPVSPDTDLATVTFSGSSDPALLNVPEHSSSPQAPTVTVPRSFPVIAGCAVPHDVHVPAASSTTAISSISPDRASSSTPKALSPSRRVRLRFASVRAASVRTGLSDMAAILGYATAAGQPPGPGLGALVSLYAAGSDAGPDADQGRAETINETGRDVP